jgi:hypothetical protein
VNATNTWRTTTPGVDSQRPIVSARFWSVQNCTEPFFKGVQCGGFGPSRVVRSGGTREGKLEKGAFVRVMFFGEQALSGIVQAVDKVTATIAFGLAVGPWAVTVPRDWLQKSEGAWLLEIG